MDPIGSLIGTMLLGFGTMLLYGSYKDRRVFGADGIIPQAIAKGSITNVDSSPQAFGGFASGAVLGGGGGKATGSASKLDRAFNAISDKALGEQIESKTYGASSSSTRGQLMPLAQLLALADARGFRDSVTTIREYVEGVTGERI